MSVFSFFLSPSLPHCLPIHPHHATIPLPFFPPPKRERERERARERTGERWRRRRRSPIMASFPGGRGPHHLDPPPSLSFPNAVALILSRWAALRMAVHKQWGGADSPRKAQDLASAVLVWFSSHSPKASNRVEELENLLHEFMVLSFNADVEDGSIEEIAEKLMIVHEDCHP